MEAQVPKFQIPYKGKFYKLYKDRGLIVHLRNEEIVRHYYNLYIYFIRYLGALI